MPAVAFLRATDEVLPQLRVGPIDEVETPMTSHLKALCVDANNPSRLARFWADLLGWVISEDPQGGKALLPSDDTGFRLRFLQTQEPKAGQNHMHFDLTSTSDQDHQQTVARSLALGARHIDIGQRPDEGQVVLADPEGNWHDPS